MKYVVTVNGASIDVSLDPEGIQVDGQQVRAHLAELDGTPLLLVTIGKVTRRVLVRRGLARGQYTLWIDGFRYEVEAVDERTRAIRALSAAVSGPTGPLVLRAPMPGLILRVHVKTGDAVQVGESLVVIEAMKMENELRAPAAGTVRAVPARAGSAVEKGAVLVELE